MCAARRGDRSALAALLVYSRAYLTGLVRSRVGNGWTGGWVEDVVQEAIADVLRAYGTCRARSLQEYHGWLRAIAQREIANLLRAEAHRRSQPIREDRLSAADTMDLARDYRVGVLDEALRELSHDAHRLLWGHVLAGETWSEVGDALGIAATAAKRRYQRLQERLRKRYAEGTSGREGGAS